MYVVYDYECRLCGQTEERMVRSEDADRQRCELHGTKVTRLMAPTRTTFKFHDRKLKP